MESTVDISVLERRVAKFQQTMRKMAVEWAQDMQDEIGASMRGSMDPAPVPAGTRSNSTRVGSRAGDGGIRDATYRGARGNISMINLRGELVESEFGISSTTYPYVKIHDEGGEIRPKKAKALIVPVSEQARDALKAAGGDPRSMNLFVVKSKSGKGLLARRDGKGIEPMFLLLGKVTIKARPIRKPALERFTTTALPELSERMRSDASTAWETMG